MSKLPRVIGRPATALLIIDMINTLDFDAGPKLLRHALPAARAIVELKTRARQAGMPIIYVNDNYDNWTADFDDLIQRCLQPNVLGRALAEVLAPDNDDDLFVLKPKHSGFHGTPLEILLRQLKVDTLILTGIAGDVCVLFTANDAYMRGFELYVPRDAVASVSAEANEYTLRYMERVLKADTRCASEL